MEQRTPGREHSQDQGLNRDRAENRRRIPHLHPAEGREASAGKGHGDDTENDGDEQQHPADFPRYADTAMRPVIGGNGHSLLSIGQDL